jgi:oxygen-dependent protoporphyrinogen oxidase
MADHKRVAIIGAGVSGLAAAYRLRQVDPSIETALMESSDRVGGVVRSQQVDGFCIEHGPDSLLTQVPWGVDLCQRVGVADELVSTCQENQGVFVVCRGRLERLPEGLALMAPQRLWPIAASPILSIRGKLRLACEYAIPRKKTASDESLTQFVTRRLGREAFERLVQPLVSGIYMGSPDRLSVRATFPRFVEMEEKHGSLIRAASAQRSALHSGKNGHAPKPAVGGPAYAMFVAPRGGMQRFPQAIAAQLPAESIRLRCPVQQLVPLDNGRWQVVALDQASQPRVEEFDAVVLATSATVAGHLLDAVAPSLAAELAAIDHSSCLVVNVALRRDQIQHKLDAFGFVSPLIERRAITACTFSSTKYPGRAPEGYCLMRAFLGGAANPEALDWSDQRIRATTMQELNELLGIQGEPHLFHIERWRRTMPQYELGHLERVARIERLASDLSNLSLAGNAYHGAGVAHCIRSGQQAADAVIDRLRINNQPEAKPLLADCP